MSNPADSARPADPGLTALVMLLRLQGVAADAGQIRHRLGTDTIGAAEMIRCAKDLGLKQWTVTDPQGLDTTVAVYNLDATKKPDPNLFVINYTRNTGSAN